MKKLVLIFGLLDLIALIKSFEHMIEIFKSEFLFTWMNVIWLILYFSLIVSAVFLLLSSKTGLWIYYIQFPFRLLWTSGLSFGFIIFLSRLSPENGLTKNVFLIIAPILEVGRLVLTIIIHKKYFTSRQVENEKT